MLKKFKRIPLYTGHAVFVYDRGCVWAYERAWVCVGATSHRPFIIIVIITIIIIIIIIVGAFLFLFPPGYIP